MNLLQHWTNDFKKMKIHFVFGTESVFNTNRSLDLLLFIILIYFIFFFLFLMVIVIIVLAYTDVSKYVIFFSYNRESAIFENQHTSIDMFHLCLAWFLYLSCCLIVSFCQDRGRLISMSVLLSDVLQSHLLFTKQHRIFGGNFNVVNQIIT